MLTFADPDESEPAQHRGEAHVQWAIEERVVAVTSVVGVDHAAAGSRTVRSRCVGRGRAEVETAPNGAVLDCKGDGEQSEQGENHTGGDEQGIRYRDRLHDLTFHVCTLWMPPRAFRLSRVARGGVLWWRQRIWLLVELRQFPVDDARDASGAGYDPYRVRDVAVRYFVAAVAGGDGADVGVVSAAFAGVTGADVLEAEVRHHLCVAGQAIQHSLVEQALPEPGIGGVDRGMLLGHAAPPVIVAIGSTQRAADREAWPPNASRNSDSGPRNHKTLGRNNLEHKRVNPATRPL